MKCIKNIPLGRAISTWTLTSPQFEFPSKRVYCLTVSHSYKIHTHTLMSLTDKLKYGPQMNYFKLGSLFSFSVINIIYLSHKAFRDSA